MVDVIEGEGERWGDGWRMRWVSERGVCVWGGGGGRGGGCRIKSVEMKGWDVIGYEVGRGSGE
jgi:hypothetical protein